MIDHSESLPCDVRALTHSINTTGTIPQYFEAKNLLGYQVFSKVYKVTVKSNGDKNIFHERRSVFPFPKPLASRGNNFLQRRILDLYYEKYK